MTEGREKSWLGAEGKRREKTKLRERLRERRTSRRDVISIDDDHDNGDEIEGRKGWRKRNFYSNASALRRARALVHAYVL